MRDLFIVIGVAVIAIFAGSIIYIYAPRVASTSAAQVASTTQPTSVTPVSGTPVAITILKQGTDAPQDMGRANYRIENADQLATLWQLLFGVSGPNPPAIDFTKQEVLAVFDGTHATGGYTISIDEVADGAVRTVVVTHTAPGSNCALSDGFTAPYEVVAVPKTTLALSHIDNSATSACN